jgi:peptidoglycan-N-acetylglucosamine deacetylase
MRLSRHGHVFSLGASFVVLAATLAGCPEKNEAESPACVATQALSAEEIRGGSMPEKTVALTFDDGPGARTLELSAYLKGEGIGAAFFVNGKNLQGGADPVLAQLVADGHVVANHTETHASLSGRTVAPRPEDGVVVEEVEQTHVKITAFVPNERLLFRPPYGDYDATTYAALEGTPMNKYVGPIGWDIGDHMADGRAADWDCWVEGSDAVRLTTQQCGDLYLAEIAERGKGIVLLHDPYGWEQGHTVDMVKYVVPKLKESGYAFLRVDLVPDIDALLPPLPPEDAGTGSSSGGASSGSTGSPDASGGKPDPCPPSPQP